MLQLVLELSEARQRAASARMLAQVAVVCAAFAGGVAIWSGARADAAGDRSDRLARDLVEARTGLAEAAEAAVTAELSRGLWSRRQARVTPRPRPAASSVPGQPPERQDPWVEELLLMELEELREELVTTQERLVTLQEQVAEEGERARQYVDRRLQQQQPSQSTADLQEELGALWVRMQVLEQRVGVR